MEIAIREAGTKDAEAVAELVGQLGYPTEMAAVESRIERLVKDPASEIFVAVADRQIVGLATLHLVPLIEYDGPACQLTALVVAEGQRGRGVGRKLTQAVEDTARARGCFGVVVTSGIWRPDAHAFYRAYGFEETGRRFIKAL